MSENMFCSAHKSNNSKFDSGYERTFGKRVTVWEKKSKEGTEWEHNHIEDGWYGNPKPTPNNKLQELSWKNHEWRKTYAIMKDNRIIVGDHDYATCC
jgi:hypothetical protein